MNLLRHTRHCNTLKLYHPNWWYSLSFTYAPLHSQCDYKHARLIDVCLKTKQNRIVSKCLRNTYGHVYFRRELSSNQQSVIQSQTSLLTDIKRDLNPYIQLIRFDRPIGKRN